MKLKKKNTLMAAPKEKSGIFNLFLNGIEKLGNRLPSPVMIFLFFSILIMVVSAFLANAGVSVIHPATGDTMDAINLLSIPQLQAFLGNVVGNFQGFPPLGLVLVVMIGAGLAEKTKFMETAMRGSIANLPKGLLTTMIFLVGIMANAVGDAGFIILPPLAATLFLSVKRHPLIGLFAAFAGVAAGFAANLIINMGDVLLAAFTLQAAQTIDAYINISPAMNMYFLFISTFMLTAAGVFVTEKIIAPRFEGEELPEELLNEATVEAISPEEKRGIKLATLSVLAYAAILVFLSLVPLYNGQAFLVGSNGGLMDADSTFMRGLVPIITLLFFIPGLVYGIATKQIKSSFDLVKLIGDSLSDMGGYILLAFAASQFIALFNQSNIGIILAVEGAHFLQDIGLTGGPLFVAFILFCAFINLFIGSASAKWAMLAPIFIPMFMLMGYDPAQTQIAFRIGDSITNPISPLFPYFPMIVGFASKYKKNIGMGTLISNMIPYSLVFGVLWIILFLVFFFLGLPLGPA
ncbi:MAG: AbgT family transporter [Turicibacter sp.]|nr:AbgT family transporter [Turicibacter sp.]